MATVAAMGVGQAQGELFPFAIPWDDAAPSVANVSAWNAPIPDKNGFVVAKNGHFYAADGQRLRFLGTNLCFRGTFPEHKYAEIEAARMAKFGINIVRLHHPDSQPFPAGIWDPKFPGLTHISEEALDRYDYLIYQLKKHGIYTDINLHVSRTLGALEGIEDADKLPSMNKGVDNFHPRMIELQKEYARALLTHVNKYTGNAYINEPAIAVIEINNENSLLSQWAWNGLDDLPQSTLKYLDAGWLDYLRGKYKDDATLRQAWATGEQKIGAEMLPNGDFGKGAETWSTEQQGTGRATTVVGDDGPQGQKAVRVSVTQGDETGWHVQFYSSPVDYEKGKTCTLTFWAKAQPARRVNVNIHSTRDPWHQLGFSDNFDLTTEWKQYTFHMQATETYKGGRVGFSDLAATTGDVWFSGVSLKPGGVYGFPEGESLAARNVTRPRRSEMGGRSTACQRDYAAFIIATEGKYWREMHGFIKGELKAHAPVTGTQMAYTVADTQAGMEYMDEHAYWHHPSFPGQAWDGRNWWVENQSMVTYAGGVIPGLAFRRVKGYPYTVSEFNAPAPNQYSAESHVILGAYSAFQDWDGIFNFAWSHSDDWQSNKIPNFFDTDSHVLKLVTLPAVAALCRRGDVAPAKQELVASTTPQSGLESPMWPMNGTSAGTYGIPTTDALVHRIALKLGQAKEGVSGPKAVAGDSGVFVSDNGLLGWNTAEKGREFVTINAPASKAYIGFTDERPVTLGEVSLTPGKTRLGWSCITLTAMDAKDTIKPGRILLTASGFAENPGWAWETKGTQITVRDKWGTGPTMCEGIAAQVKMKGVAEVWALDTSGKRMTRVRVAGGAFGIGPEYKTLWYEVVVR